VLVLIARGDPISAGAPFGVVQQLIRAAAGIAEGEKPQAQLVKLAAAVKDPTFLAEILGLPAEHVADDLAAARANPVLLNDRMRLAFEDWLDGEAARRPVMLIIEDLHWGDAPSVKFIDAALRALRERALFVLALARKDVHDLFPNLWAQRDLQEIRLGELARKAAEKLARDVLGEGAPADKVAWICERAAGNALYLEELIRAVAEGASDDGQVPETVLAMVQARLAALPAEARRVLRAASVFGEAFWHGGVEKLAGDGFDARVVDDLVEREIFTRRRESRFPDDREYVFRHALFREASYGMLTDADRKLGHRLAADWLLAAGERQPVVLAEHLERGGEPARAIEWYERAAAEALAGNDYAGAVERASRGAGCGAEGPGLGRLRLVQAMAHNYRGEQKDTEWAAGQALELLTPRTAEWYQAARQVVAARLPSPMETLTRIGALLVEPPTDPAALGYWLAAQTAVAGQLFYHGDRTNAFAALRRAESRASEVTGAALVALARVHAQVADFDGAHDVARTFYLEGARICDSIGDRRYACTLRANVGWLEATELGLHEQAIQTLTQTMEVAQRLGLVRSIASCKQNLGAAIMQLGRLDEARRLIEESIDVFVSQDDPRMEGGSRFYLVTLFTLIGDYARAEAEAQRAIELARDVPTTRCCSRAAYARLLLAAGRPAEALEQATESKKIFDGLGGIEEGEALIRLAWAEALEANGRAAEARAAIAEARSRCLARAEHITDPDVRRAFLRNVPENVRTLELAEKLA
jgi:tetratricopeptide (TPR) repeat protein